MAKRKAVKPVAKRMANDKRIALGNNDIFAEVEDGIVWLFYRDNFRICLTPFNVKALAAICARAKRPAAKPKREG